METHEKNYPTRRRPWAAVFLSLLMPGLGQIYCGDIVRGLTVMLVVVMCSSMWMFGMLWGNVCEGTPMAFFLMMWGLILIATIFASIDAWRRARRTRYDYPLKDYNRWEMYLVLLWISGAGTIGFTAMVKMNLFEAFYVPAQTMYPTIVSGDRLCADKRIYQKSDPQYGDVVLFSNPEDRGQTYIKRIVAMGGDTVEFKEGKLIINDQELPRKKLRASTVEISNRMVEGTIYQEDNGTRQYQIFLPSEFPDNNNFGPVTVPAYHCFLMGDNRFFSKDSRFFGPISIGALKGRCRFIYWPVRRWDLRGRQE
jgi:signal peptidase I